MGIGGQKCSVVSDWVGHRRTKDGHRQTKVFSCVRLWVGHRRTKDGHRQTKLSSCVRLWVGHRRTKDGHRQTKLSSCVRLWVGHRRTKDGHRQTKLFSGARLWIGHRWTKLLGGAGLWVGCRVKGLKQLTFILPTLLAGTTGRLRATVRSSCCWRHCRGSLWGRYRIIYLLLIIYGARLVENNTSLLI